MSASPVAAAGSSPALTGLQDSLPALLRAYSEARAVVEAWPATGIIEERPRDDSQEQPNYGRRRSAADAVIGLLRWLAMPLRVFCRPVSRWWYGYAVRPVALFWIDAHIAGKVRRVQLELRRFRLRHATEMSPEMRAVDDLLMLLSYTSGVAVGFERLLTLLRLVPVIGLLVTIGLIPLNVDFGDAGLSRLAGWAQSSVGVVPVVVMLLNPPVVRFGFRWKRAVFMGGVVERRTRLDDRARYAGLGGANIYEMENRVFRDLGVRKKIEAPVDLLLSPAVYIALNSTVSFGVGLASFVIDPGGLEGGPGGVSVEAVSLAVMYWFVWEVVKRHRRRLAHGAAV